MRKTFFTIVLFCLFIMIISGCVSPDHSDLEKQEPIKVEIIIEYKSTLLDISDVERKMYYYLTPQNMTVSDLSQGNDKAIWERFKNDIIFELSVFQIALEKSVELGFDVLSSSEQKSIEEAYNAAVAASMQSIQSSVEAAVKSDSSLNFDAEQKKQLNQYFSIRGYDYDTYKETLIEEFIVNKVKDHYTKEVTVSEADVKAKYDNDLAVQKSNIESSPSYIEQQLLFGTTVLYYPEGYMYAKHILISFESATRGAAAIAYTNGDISAYNKIIREGYPEIEERLNQVLRELDSDADFDQLAAKYNEDAQMNEEPFKSNGFLIGPYSSFDIAEYTEALTTLTKQGDYSEPVVSYLGGFIIYCEKMLSGAVPFEEIQSEYTEGLLQQQKAITWSTLSQQWFEDAEENGELKLYTDKLKF
jgi:parvulin-like peptidyl-prolyl isomerase